MTRYAQDKPRENSRDWLQLLILPTSSTLATLKLELLPFVSVATVFVWITDPPTRVQQLAECMSEGNYKEEGSMTDQ